MNNLLNFSDKNIAKKLIHLIKEKAKSIGHIKIMEVCGTHTMQIGKLGIRSILPDNIELISGPGCPVCVTPGSYIDSAAKLAIDKQVRIVTFGDMVRVPGDRTSLEKARSMGADIDIITSPFQSIEIAKNSSQEVVFLSVGFETTTPMTAMTILNARQNKIKNLSFFIAHRVVPPALELLIQDSSIKIAGFLLPGHVSSIIGEKPYEILKKYKIPGVITGFEAIDILTGILDCITMISTEQIEIHNAYKRAVPSNGNPKAQKVVEQVFTQDDAEWRGIGTIPGTGLRLRDDYKQFDAAEKFNLKIEKSTFPSGCSCGDVLKGRIPPNKCKLFGKLCTPQNPVGPCMVSSEGSCAAYYKYSNL